METKEHFFPFAGEERLHLKQFGAASERSPVVCLQGAFSSGRVFYSKDARKGLAPALAAHGFQVWVPDYRGHGLSTPTVTAQSKYGMRDLITDELPFFFQRIQALSGQSRFHVVAHSDGGIFLVSMLARFPEWAERIASLTFLGSKYSIRVPTLKRLLAVNVGWYQVAPLLVRAYGYFPAKKLKLGSDDDTAAFTLERMPWLKDGPWVDPVDGFDYAAAWNKIGHPPLIAFAANRDPYLGNVVDARRFVEKLGYDSSKLTLLGRAQGFKGDYNHTTLLTQSTAAVDHFPRILAWLQKNEKR